MTPIYQNKLIETKSIFYGFIYQIDSINLIDDILLSLKNEYKKASHFVYAYIIEGKTVSFDDGEPKNTAGYPLLFCLSKAELSNYFIVVVRFFGGTKLGASKLTKTYRKVASLLVNDVKKTISN